MRHAFRTLLKSPGFSLIAIATLALGIGLNTAMFSIMNLLLFQPLPFPARDRLVRIYRTTPQSQNADHTAGDYVELAQATKDVGEIAAFRLWGYSLAVEDRPPVNLNALRVSASFFRVLGMKPELGRYFAEDEDRPGNHVIVLSYATWHSQFGGDRSVVGRTVRIDGEPTTIIGVTPSAFSSLFLWGPGEAFRPLALTAAERVDPNDAGLAILARMKPGTTLEAFNAQVAALAHRLAAARPPARANDGLRAVLLESTTRPPGVAGFSAFLLGVAGFVLLIACANLANLQLARTIARAQELAVRTALGASRFRLLQPALLESLLLSLVGGACGVIVALWANDWIGAQVRSTAGMAFALPLDWRVLIFALAVSVVTGVGFGLIPAVVLSQVRVNDTLKSGTRGNTGGRLQNRFRHGLIAAQFALALMLLATAGLYIRGFDRLLQREIGWDHQHLLQAVVNLPSAKYPTQERSYAFFSRLQERLATLPHVESASVGWTLPAVRYLTTRSYVVEGAEPPPAGREPQAYVNGVMPSYLPTLGAKLISGRNFTASDTATSTPVAIINESMAQALFPHENPIGHRIGSPDASNRGWMEIVGVMADLRFAVSVAAPATRFVVFRPLAQETWNYAAVVLRARQPAALAETLRRTINEFDPDLPVQQVNTVDGMIRMSGSGLGLVGTILTSFALLGLFLAALGLYGVITRLVTQRMPEMGVRIALGAQRRDIMRLILHTGLRLAGAGTLIGLVGALGLGQLVALFTPDMPMQDPDIIAGVSILLIGVAALACWLPARRASRVDPVVALRAE